MSAYDGNKPLKYLFCDVDVKNYCTIGIFLFNMGTTRDRMHSHTLLQISCLIHTIWFKLRAQAIRLAQFEIATIIIFISFCSILVS